MGVPDLLSKPGTTQREILAATTRAGHVCGADGGVALAQFLATLDRSKPHRMQCNLPDGRRYDRRSDPTPDGGFVVSVSDITALVRAEAAAGDPGRAAAHHAGEQHLRRAALYHERRLRAQQPRRHADDLPEPPNWAARRWRKAVGDPGDHGHFGAGEAGERERQHLLAMDRRVPHRAQRIAADGRVLNFASDPTPDGGFVVSLTDVSRSRGRRPRPSRAEILGVMLGNIRHGIVLFDAEGRLVAPTAKLRQMLELPMMRWCPAPPCMTRWWMRCGRARRVWRGRSRPSGRRGEQQPRPRFAPIRSLRHGPAW